MITRTEPLKAIGIGGIAVLPDTLPRLVKAVRHHGASLGPVTVRPRPWGHGYWLVAGAVELAAVRVLKFRTVEAIIGGGSV